MAAPTLADTLKQLLEIASPPHLVKLLHHSSTHSSPESGFVNSPFIAPYPVTPGGAVTIVSEIANIFLAGSVLPRAEPERRPFLHASGAQWTTTAHLDNLHPSVLSGQIQSLLSEPIALPADERLFGEAEAAKIGDELEKTALRWWTEASGPISDGSQKDHDEYGRWESLFALGGGVVDEEVELSVTVLVSL